MAGEEDGASRGEERSGTVTLGDTEWRWTASPTPRDGEADFGFMEWHDFVFRRKDDPGQEARGRGGIPRNRWSEENVREVLCSCRVRTWRDGSGALWHVRRSRQDPVAGISPEMSDRGGQGPSEVLTFRKVGGDEGEPVTRRASGLESLAGVDDGRLAELLEG